jgi:hypothetical protein
MKMIKLFCFLLFVGCGPEWDMITDPPSSAEDYMGFWADMGTDDQLNLCFTGLSFCAPLLAKEVSIKTELPEGLKLNVQAQLYNKAGIQIFKEMTNEQMNLGLINAETLLLVSYTCLEVDNEVDTFKITIFSNGAMFVSARETCQRNQRSQIFISIPYK